jgi:protein-disulfide isomerase
MRRFLPFIIVAAVALLTVGGAIALYHGNKPAVLTKSNESESGTAGLRSRGPAGAKVVLEEFGDFECPPCGILSEPINNLERDFQPHVRVIYRHFPLLMHRHAMEASAAAEAAGMQGRFWEMHDLLYREQRVWSKAPEVKTLFASYAGMLGLDPARFAADMTSADAMTRIRADQSEGTKLGVTNTPTIFLNGKAIPATSLNPDSLRKMVEEAVKANPGS